MPVTKKPADELAQAIHIPEPRQGGMHFYLMGTSPYLYNSMSSKVKKELLLPSGRKTAAERAGSLKHSPLDEFRASMNMQKGEEYATLLCVMASCVKGAMMTAALDVPGATKASIGRLVWVEGMTISMWGVPQLLMTPVRSADANKTPDIRTRAILPEWVTVISVNWIAPLVTHTAVANLLMFAGTTVGIGDWRPEKGKGAMGQFRLCAEDDPEFVRIKESSGRKPQQEAVDNPECYDEESQELLDWWHEEVAKRGRK
jgi:hypothetical protein